MHGAPKDTSPVGASYARDDLHQSFALQNEQLQDGTIGARAPPGSGGPCREADGAEAAPVGTPGGAADGDGLLIFAQMIMSDTLAGETEIRACFDRATPDGRRS